MTFEYSNKSVSLINAVHNQCYTARNHTCIKLYAYMSKFPTMLMFYEKLFAINNNKNNVILSGHKFKPVIIYT